MKHATLLLTFIVAITMALQPTAAQHAPEPHELAPFNKTLSNNAPLVFGMSANDAAIALGSPLTYIHGRPGNKVFMVLRHVGGSGWLFRNDPLYLQFRRGRLTGWKGDWNQNWMWQ